MSLTEIFQNSPEQLAGKHIQQIISFAGEGKLRDGNDTCAELREYLGALSSAELGRHADECLGTSFPDSGLALQDIVNQLGSRLGFKVEAGRYRGTTGTIGFDGLWRAPEGNAIIVEVKTTDAYRIDLDTLAVYRDALVREGRATEDESSVLVVVGRQDTGDLEAQIRGSKHAWDIRLVSVDSLLKSVRLKEEVEDPEIPRRIRQVLIPQEFTRLDGILDLLFSTTEEVKGEVEAEADGDGPKFTPVSFHGECAERIQAHLGVKLVKKSRATYASPNEGTVLVCAISKEHDHAAGAGYWFAFHPHQREALSDAENAYVGFGCGSPETIILIPFSEFDGWVDGLHTTTTKEGRTYWHVRIHRDGDRFSIYRKKGSADIDVTDYRLADPHGTD